MSRRPARAVSNTSSASPTSRTVRCSSDSAHRSISGRSAYAGASPAVGDQDSAWAYRVKNATVFQ